uniref:C-type lectin domain-containing protein n=1 Tax=Poecilia reticulata TaxID=8081 RepID=A0A3P9MXV4_POERE
MIFFPYSRHRGDQLESGWVTLRSLSLLKITSLFRYWANGKPNGPSGEQCVAGSFSDSGRWSDESCTLSLPFVCFKPSNASHFCCFSSHK